MQVERTPGSTRTSLGLEQRHKEGQESHLRRSGYREKLEARVAQRPVSLWPPGQESLAFSLEDQRAKDLGSLECPGRKGLMVGRKP